MRWLRRREVVSQPVHRGRIWRDTDGWWRYSCTECDMGAGSRGGGATGVVPVYIDIATRHARATR